MIEAQKVVMCLIKSWLKHGKFLCVWSDLTGYVMIEAQKVICDQI